jgi:RimJ/RimL family protein N-acetyltransferase
MIIVRKMETEDYIGLKENIFKEMPIEIIKNNVINNVESIKNGCNWMYLVAEYDNKVVGTMYLEHKQSSVAKHIGTLYSVVTSEDYKNKGICKALFNEVLKYSKDLGIEIITLSVRRGSIAETVYQKMGFQKYGQLPNGLKDNEQYYDEVSYYFDIHKS